jgi:two-component system LytT family response regulator
MTSPAKRLRAVIVDDEPPARALLRDYLAGQPDVEVVAECGNGFEAVQAIGEMAPDLVFLDVQMPKLDGFEVLELLEPGPVVVFVTAHDEFAIRAFEVNAVDYLLKPFGRERFAAALERARGRRAGRGERSAAGAGAGAVAGAPDAAKLAAARRPPGRYSTRVLVKEGVHVHVIPADRIEVLEAQDDYVAIHAAGRIHLKTQPLADLAAALDPARFVRVHRSFVVNVECIARIEAASRDARVAVLKSGREIPISRSGYARLQEKM